MNRRIASSRKKLEHVISDLKSNYFQTNRVAEAFLTPTLRPNEAEELLQNVREKKAANPRVYDHYLKYYADRGDLGAVERGLALAAQDGFALNDADSFIICAHAGAGELSRARDLLRDRIAQGSAPGAVRVYNLIVRLLCFKGKTAEAEEVLGWAHKHSTPIASTYFPLISYARKKLDTVNALRLYSQMRSYKVQPDIYVFCELLNLFPHDDPRTAKLLGDMQACGIKPTTVAHNIVIASEGRAGDVDAVRRRIKEMREQDVTPDAMTYLALVHGYKVKKDPVRALAVLDEMRDVGIAPEIVTYALVARTMFAAGDEAGVKDLLKEMDSRHIRPDSKFFAGLILPPSNTQPKWVLDEMKKRRIARDERMFDSQIRIAGSETVSMLRTYAEMRAHGFLPSTSLVSFIFHKLKVLDRARDCKDILLDLEDAGAKPAVKLYNMVLGLLSRAGDPDSCAEVLARMKRSSHAHPDEHSYHSLALGFGFAGMSHLSVRTLRQAKADGFSSPGLIGSVLGALGTGHLNALTHSENINGESINGEGIHGDNINGESINKEAGKGNQVEVEGLMKEMCDNGLVTTRSFNDAIKYAMKDIETSKRLYQMMEANSIRRDLFTYSLLIRTAMRHNDADFVFELASQMQGEGLQFDVHIYNTLVSLSAKRGEFDRCEQLLTRMHNHGADCTPDATSYHELIIELVRGKVCEPERALRLVDSMLSHKIIPDVDTIYWVAKTMFDSGAPTIAWDLVKRIRAAQGHIHKHIHKFLMREYILRGGCTQLEELLDRVDTVEQQPTVWDFNGIFAKVAERGGGDTCAAAYVFGRMLEFGLQPTKETYTHLGRIYGPELGWKEGEEKTAQEVSNRTQELLMMVPELFATSKQERIAMREGKEKENNVSSLDSQFPSTFIEDSEDVW